MKGSDVQTILIVDDEPLIRALLALVLNRAGFSVLTADSGFDALLISQSRRGEIGLLITDITLPGMNGWTLAREVIAADPDLPVLFMSAGCADWDLDRYEHAEFLAKPFSIASLLTEVQNLLGETSVHGVS
jgi:two-component system cell cycle sensor histidine kinase/response regulator CckA